MVNNGSGHAPASVVDLRAAVVELLGLADIGEHDDLFEHGLDSLGLIKLAASLRQGGTEISFEELAAEPTLSRWSGLLASRVNPASSRTAPTGVARPESDAPFDLATMQYAYWIGRQDGQPLGGVGAHFYTEFDGRDVDPQRLAAALRAVVGRHPMLRARFLDDGRQVIGQSDGRSPLTVHDLRTFSAAEVAGRLGELRAHHTHRRMDIGRGEVLDVALSLLPGVATRLHINLDMIVADAVSLRILLEDLRRCYLAPATPLPAQSYGFDRYLADRAPRRRAAAERARAWWNERLGELPEPPALPTVIDASHPTSLASAYGRSTRWHHWIRPQDALRLSENAQRHGVTMAAALATAFAEVMSAWSGRARLLLNLPLFDREPLHPEVDALIGDFSSSVLLDVDLSEDLSFAAQAKLVQRRLHAAVDHGAYSGVEVLRDLARANGGHQVLAPVVYTSAIGLGPLFSDAVQHCFGRPVWIISQGPQVWLDAQVTELDDGLLLNWDVREHAFEAGVVDAAFGAYRRLVAQLVDDPAGWQHPVPAQLPEDQLRRRRLDTDRDPCPPTRPLHEAFFAHADSRPQRPALITSTGERLSYAELAQRARRFASLLVDRGLAPGDAVGVRLPRGVRQVVAVLGILAAGGAYVPIAPDQPTARTRRVLTTARAHLLVDSDAAGVAMSGVESVTEAQATRFPALVAMPAVDPADVAYVLFTSGSTGEPKGVEVSHAAAAHTIDVLNTRYGLGAHDRSLALAGLDFDMSVYDLFAPLSVGGGVVLIDDSERRDASRWAGLVREHGVTTINCVPTLLDMLLSTGEDLGGSLRLVLVGGERVAADLPSRLAERVPACRFVALGGMTEAAIHSTVNEDTDDPTSWGVPLPGVRCRVVDDRGRDCPDWVAGTLWVGGAGVARGYRGDPERSAASFVDHEGTRWFRSGDLARYRPDGTLEFLGRIDHQLKLRGHRIEPGEVEAALQAHPAVDRAIVVLLSDPVPRLAGAVVVPHREGEEPPTAEKLIAAAAELLPGYMVPEHVAVWPALPLTANGKPDRAAIIRRLAEELQPAEDSVAEPEGDIELTLAQTWTLLLGRDSVGATDDFFMLGGDSLLATRMVSALRRQGIQGARVAQLFATPVLRDFGNTLSLGAMRGETLVRADPQHRYEPFPLTEAQQAYWIGRNPEFTLGGVGTNHYTEFDGADVDLTALERAWRRLVHRHEALRIVLDEQGHQRVLQEVPALRIPVVEASPEGQRQALEQLREHLAHRAGDPGQWPLFEVGAVRYQDGEQWRTRVGISLDYIVLDARSIMLLYAELEQLYLDPETDLDPIGMSFRDYVLQVVPDKPAVARAQQYWRERLASLPPGPRLPLGMEPASLHRPRFTRRQTYLQPGAWKAFVERARQWGVTPSTLLLACYGEVLAAWSGQSALALTLTLFNRDEAHPDVHRVLGDFTSLTLTSYQREPGEDFRSAVSRLHRQLGRDLDHREASALWAAQQLAHRHGAVDAVVPVVFTSSIGVGDGMVAELSGAFGEPVWGLSQTPQVQLDNQVIPVRGGVTVQWDAVEELFSPGVLDAMFDAHRRLLDWVCTTTGHELVPDLLPLDQRGVRVRVNATSGPLPEQSLHEGFFTAADRHPQRVALIDSGGQLSYRELAAQAQRVAAALIARGIRPGETVAVTLPKGAEQIVAVLGVLAAGGVYVPVGVDQPSARRERIHRAAGIRAVIGEGGWALEELFTEASHLSDSLGLPVRRKLDDLAYVIFTSGSTGEPKGVEISHRAAVNTIVDINERFEVGPEDRVLALAALDFDLSVYDIFGVLAAGGALVVPAESDRQDALRWLDLVRQHGVTVWNTVPALLEMLLLAAKGQPFPESLRLAMVSGDWVGLDVAPMLREQSEGRVRLVALGGATEGAIWSNAFELDQVAPHWRSVPYGFPLRNQRYRVVDPHGRDCPDWTPGELWIGGAGVAEGYRSDAALTAIKFVEHEGTRWYRTGDLGRYWPDGTLEFLGRIDHQVKIGGHRLELGEVEACLESHPAVRRAVVVATGERAARRLRGFVQLDSVVADRELARHLALSVPAYAIPGQISALDALPLTANGKVDRAALAELAAALPIADGSPPSGELEERIAAIWSELLDVDVQDEHANFFTLGGSSLLAIRLVTTLRQLFAVDISTRAFLTSPTIAALSSEVARAVATAENDTESGEL